MNRILCCNLSNGETIQFKLLQNAFVDEWLEHHKKINNIYDFDQFYYQFPQNKINFDLLKVKKNEKELQNTIIELNKLGVNFPISPDAVVLKNDSESRKMLNKLHRHFTTGHRTISQREERYHWLENSELTYELAPEQYNLFSTLVHRINDLVHETEIYLKNERLETFTKKYHEYCVIYTSNGKTIHGDGSYFRDIKSEHYKFFSDDLSYDLWLPLTQIQGKNYVIAYFDYDDPTHWDISTNIMYSGSFAFGNHGYTKEPAIENWLQSFDITPGPLTCGMPLGKSISGMEFFNSLNKNKIVGISINE